MPADGQRGHVADHPLCACAGQGNGLPLQGRPRGRVQPQEAGAPDAGIMIEAVAGSRRDQSGHPPQIKARRGQSLGCSQATALQQRHRHQPGVAQAQHRQIALPAVVEKRQIRRCQLCQFGSKRGAAQCCPVARVDDRHRARQARTGDGNERRSALGGHDLKICDPFG